MEQPVERRFRKDLLYRLHWDIFGPLRDIQVVQEAGSPDISVAPFLEHSVASEQLFEPPINKLSVVIDSCETKAALDEDDEDCQYQPPAPAIIENIYKCEDEAYSQPEYLGNGIKSYSVRLDDQGGDGVHFFSGGNIPEGAKFWFKDASGYTVEEGEVHGGDYQMSIWVYVDGDRGKSREKHWEQMDKQGNAAAQRQTG
ncbi:hypothetical protein BKA63DRAFT_585589 [Paraphoma chrysanthemicola]|nr:hypothetical protein BKA63DRAFT_585589 [Paraphoma chrysanthemicola]